MPSSPTQCIIRKKFCEERERGLAGGEQSSLPGSILSSINSHTHAGTALNYTLQGGLMQLVLGKPFSTVSHDQDKSI